MCVEYMSGLLYIYIYTGRERGREGERDRERERERAGKLESETAKERERVRERNECECERENLSVDGLSAASVASFRETPDDLALLLAPWGRVGLVVEAKSAAAQYL